MNSKIIYIGTPTINSTMFTELIKNQVEFISGLNNPDVNVCEFSNYCDLDLDLLIQEIPQHKQNGWYRKFEKKRVF